MSLKLTEKPKNYIYVDNRKIKIKPYFKNVLICLEVEDDEIFTDVEKIEICAKILIASKVSNLQEKAKILNEVFKSLSENNEQQQIKSFDFKQDADYIYSAFMQTYNIDLLSKKYNKMHWNEFVALFSGLPENTRIMQIIDIRMKPLPKPTKYNAEQRSELMRLKALYRVKTSKKDSDKQLADGLRKIAEALEGMAKKGG